MRPTRTAFLAALLLALALVLAACASGPTAAPSPTQPAQAAATAAPATPASEPPTPTQVPPAPTTPPTPTAVPTATPIPPTPTLAPTATTSPSPTPTAVRALDSRIAALLAKSAGISEYSYDFKMNLSGIDLSGTAYVKGAKMRQETMIAKTKIVQFLDMAKKVMYTLSPDGKTATRMDLSQMAAGQSQTPGDMVSALPADTQIVGTETIDGKKATIIQAVVKGLTQKIWVWDEKGLPLKYEMTVGSDEVSASFSNYKFAAQPDKLFELPKGVTIKDG